tara:strand:- start:395 stop:688 length:294 start_codon:yes stop_codon:yes gene_type:complete
MEKPAHNIQDTFLNNLRKDKLTATIYLMSGLKLTGYIKSFDKYSVILKAHKQDQLIFKHAISTVLPGKPGETISHRTPLLPESPSDKSVPPKPESST